MNGLSLLATLLTLTQGDTVRPEPRFFRYQRAIAIADSNTARQACATVDTTTFAHASPRLADLRLYRDGREIPYVIDVSGAVGRVVPASPVLLNIGQRNGHTIFDAQMPAQEYRTIELSIDARDFIASVDVSGSRSADGLGATRLGTFTIFDLTSQQLGRSVVIHLPPSNFRYLHFTLDGVVKPHDVRGLTVIGVGAPPMYHVVASTSRIARSARTSVITFDVPARIPVERFEIVPASSARNFSRAVRIVAWVMRGTTREIRAQTSGTMTRVHVVRDGFRIDREQLAVDLPAVSDTGIVRWVATIENGDDVPIALDRVQLVMAERQLCFEPEGPSGYMLYYGDRALRAPQYDYARVFYRIGVPAVATAGPEQMNPRFVARFDTRPFTERYPALLWGVLGIVVLVLGSIAVKTARRIEKQSV